MDPIAISAASLVAKWAAESFVKEAAKSAWAGLKHVYEIVCSKLGGNTEGAEVLDRLQKEPTSEARTAELAEVLDEYIKVDAAFAEALRCAVDEAEQQPSTSKFVTEVKGNAKVGKITNIGSIRGDVHF